MRHACLFQTVTPSTAGAVLLTPTVASAPPEQLYCRLVRARDDSPAAVAAAFDRSGLAVLLCRDESTAAAIRQHTDRPVVASPEAAAEIRWAPAPLGRIEEFVRRNTLHPSAVRWITRQQLLRDTQVLASRLPWPISGVAGVPRSGMIVAADLATRLGVPLYEARKTGELFPIDSGMRLRLGASRPPAGPLVVVEDSVNTGRSLQSVRDAAGLAEVVTAAIYVNPLAKFRPDLVAVDLPMPHYFEWHFFGSSLVRLAGFDFDGIFCEDFDGPASDESDRYLDFLRDAKPLWPARPHQVGLICTARLEKYRPQTEAWLRRQGITWTRLVMGPWATAAERSRNWNPGEFKGRALLQSRCHVFFESDPTQARAIAVVSRKPVICPPTGEVF